MLASSMTHRRNALRACRPLPLLRSIALCCFVALHCLAENDESSLGAQILESSILPLFADRCVQCHGEKQQKGGLRLDLRAEALKGGDSGPVWIAGQGGQSEIIRRLSSNDPEERMPPKGDRVASSIIEQMTGWIDSGASWPEALADSLAEMDESFWSLRVLQAVRIPELPVEFHSLARNPIDYFIFDRLAREALTPSPEAGRAVLIRRLSYDLLGIPPRPEDIERFENDPRPDAYERLVDSYLASPHFGERWARHWLDLVHFGETHGYDKDKPRPNAWPYRDYVIRAFNDDRPYSRFVEEQIAGDALYPNTLDGLSATGFISAGPWDLIGHAEVPETKVDGRIARHLDRDDMVTTTLNAFNSLTVQCARCHDHKFDPVNMEQYYRLQAVFAAVDRSEASFDPDPRTRRERTRLETSLAELEGRREELNRQIKEASGDSLVQLDAEINRLEGSSERHPAYGYHSVIEDRAEVSKWVQIDLGGVKVAERIEYMPANDDYQGIGAGFGFPVRYRIEISDGETFDENPVVVADYSDEDVTNPKEHRQRVLLNGKPLRFVRITATKLAPRSNDYIFALAEMTVLDPGGRNLALGKEVSALDSIESGERWGKKNLVDGVYPGVKRKTEETLAKLARLKADRQAEFERRVSPELRQEASAVARELGGRKREIAALPQPLKLFVGRVHTGRGAFRGTGHQGGKPREIHVLHRGDITQPGQRVRPGAVDLFTPSEDYFELHDAHVESDRRIALSRWILDRNNPLTWRSIVNRLWQHHFGRGIVDTPNDFGRMGQRPSHPELLDWLAVQFRDNGQSLKGLHRLIVTSRTYRQESATREHPAGVDGGNRLLWRMNRRRLDAESIRDSVLWLADSLDRKMYGPSFQDFVIEKPEHSPHYQYHLHDPLDPRSHRRSIYRFLVRSQQQPFMTTLDCADPSMIVDKRSETLTPLQALSLMNNRFMTLMAQRMSDPIRADHLEEDLGALFYRTTGRPAEGNELSLLTAYARDHGAANACRLLLNLNEFIFID